MKKLSLCLEIFYQNILKDWSLDMYLCCISFAACQPSIYISPQFKPIFAKNGSKENYQQYYKSNLITYVSLYFESFFALFFRPRLLPLLLRSKAKEYEKVKFRNGHQLLLLHLHNYDCWAKLKCYTVVIGSTSISYNVLLP